MRHSYSRMTVAYGIRRLDDSLVVVGAVRFTEPNSVRLRLNDYALHADDLRSFFLLGPSSLATWEQAPIPDLTGARAETLLWSNQLGARRDHRPETMHGYPIRDNLVMIVLGKTPLEAFEPEHDGFIELLPKRHAQDLEGL